MASHQGFLHRGIKFSATVALASAISVVCTLKIIENRGPRRNEVAVQTAPPGQDESRTINSLPERNSSDWGVFRNAYSEHLAQVFLKLRRDAKIRMASLEAESGILRFQKNPVAREEKNQSLLLSSNHPRVPVMGVSKQAKPLLETMKVTYIDPLDLSPGQLGSITGGIPASLLRSSFLLIPDVSGALASAYHLGR